MEKHVCHHMGRILLSQSKCPGQRRIPAQAAFVCLGLPHALPSKVAVRVRV